MNCALPAELKLRENTRLCNLSLNHFNNYARKTWLTHEQSGLCLILKLGNKEVNKGYIIPRKLAFLNINTDSSCILFIGNVF